jgi:hypothetical protein
MNRSTGYQPVGRVLTAIDRTLSIKFKLKTAFKPIRLAYKPMPASTQATGW